MRMRLLLIGGGAFAVWWFLLRKKTQHAELMHPNAQKLTALSKLRRV